ncbi:MAG: tryptophan-rich sensory protein [Patescibacteria group bacterium]|nr:tryptophan-rich sensory protein [Patescibacteria group bacterium]
MKPVDWLKLAASMIVVLAAGRVGSLFTAPAIAPWYAALAKPVLTPPSWVFGPVWTVLFLLMGAALFMVWKAGWTVRNPILAGKDGGWNPWTRRLWSGDWRKANIIAVFAIQLALNILWSYLFFGLHMPGAAFFEIFALWWAILYTMVNFYRVSKTAAWLLLPYIIWVMFAAYLNWGIWVMN